MALVLKSKDKDKIIDRAAYIAREFEPNSNYELNIMIRRDREDRRQWTLALQLIFPHMHYKREVVQLSLTRGLRHRVLPARHVQGPGVGRMIKRYTSLVDDGQATLTRWAII